MARLSAEIPPMELQHVNHNVLEVSFKGEAGLDLDCSRSSHSQKSAQLAEALAFRLLETWKFGGKRTKMFISIGSLRCMMASPPSLARIQKCHLWQSAKSAKRDVFHVLNLQIFPPNTLL